MKRFAKACAAFTGVLLIAGAAMADHSGSITIEANKSKALRLKGAASAIVVGNPNFADVAVHNEHLIFITGKTYGTTNLLIFDEAGKEIYSGDIVVTNGASDILVVNRAGDFFSYDCAGNCREILATGDQDEYFQNLAEQMQDLKDLGE